jgi:hypothetical protein
MGRKIQCNKCKDIIESKYTHDFKYCSCRTIFIDGGDEYTRVGGFPEDITYIEEDKDRG